MRILAGKLQKGRSKMMAYNFNLRKCNHAIFQRDVAQRKREEMGGRAGRTKKEQRRVGRRQDKRWGRQWAALAD